MRNEIIHIFEKSFVLDNMPTQLPLESTDLFGGSFDLALFLSRNNLLFSQFYKPFFLFDLL